MLRRTIAPLALLVFAPPITLLLWVAVQFYDGSALQLVGGFRTGAIWSQLPRPSLWAASLIGAWFAGAWLLLRFLPGETYAGPPAPSGARPTYRVNGMVAWVITHTVLIAGFASGILSASAFFARYGELLATLNVLAIVACVILRVKAAVAPTCPDVAESRFRIFDFFQGLELHPRAAGVDLKQLFNCRISMMGWSAIAVSLCAYRLEVDGRIAPALLVSSSLVVIYLLKFFRWETGYFTSLDIVHDRFGFYLCWGVLVWVPAVYPIAPLTIAARGSDLGWGGAAAIGAIGVAAIAVNYAADAQRQRVRATQGLTTVWGRPPKLIRATYRTRDGEQRENLLLASGFWGLARHFNYFPELVVALAWTVPSGYPRLVPYFYVGFLFVLLVDRVKRDDLRCAMKYGASWLDYRRLVPNKIVPWVF